MICEIFFPLFLMIYTHRIFFSKKKLLKHMRSFIPLFFHGIQRKTFFTLHMFFCLLALCLRDQDIFNSFFFYFSFAVLRKEFEVPPYSQSVELGSQIQLRCHPPKGIPNPRVRTFIFIINHQCYNHF